MDWLQRMNLAIDYIEDNLACEIDYEEISKIALCSVYQFQRMFSFVIEVPLSEYIRRRRLTLAAFDLQDRKNKVTDIALKYGYETPESFSRAFQNLHDRIEEREAFQVFGLEEIYGMDTIANKDGITIPEIWQNIGSNGEFERLHQSINGDWQAEGHFSKELGAVLAYDSYRFTSNTTFPYLIGCYKAGNSMADGYTVVDVPASLWAVFSTLHDGNGSGKFDLRSLRNRIFSEWLQTSKYNIMDGGNFEMYGTDASGYEYCELWYGIEEKQG